MQPNQNRTDSQAGEPDNANVDSDAFGLGESFTNDPSDQGGSGALPSWLQNFADATGEPGNAVTTSQGGEPQRVVSSWDDPTAAQVAPGQSQLHAELVGQFDSTPVTADANFFSDDDLPEWLRALSTDSDTIPASAPSFLGPASSSAANGTLLAPPISRAWVTAADHVEVSASANLLSSLVHVIDSRPDTVAVESSAIAPAVSASAGSAATQSVAATVAPPTSMPARSEKRSNRTQVLLIAVIIVLVLFIIIMQVQN